VIIITGDRSFKQRFYRQEGNYTCDHGSKKKKTRTKMMMLMMIPLVFYE
jgi:hypothetical protein